MKVFNFLLVLLYNCLLGVGSLLSPSVTKNYFRPTRKELDNFYRERKKCQSSLEVLKVASITILRPWVPLDLQVYSSALLEDVHNHGFNVLKEVSAGKLTMDELEEIYKGDLVILLEEIRLEVGSRVGSFKKSI